MKSIKTQIRKNINYQFNYKPKKLEKGDKISKQKLVEIKKKKREKQPLEMVRAERHGERVRMKKVIRENGR